MRDAGGIGDLLARQVEGDTPGIDADDAVGYALKVARDVAGQQHAALAAAGELAQTVEYLVARNRV